MLHKCYNLLRGSCKARPIYGKTIKRAMSLKYLDFNKGTVEYFYALNGAWQVSQAEAEVYHFQNGQKEVHLKEDIKEIIYPNGSFYRSLNGIEGVLPLEEASQALKGNTPVVYLG